MVYPKARRYPRGWRLWLAVLAGVLVLVAGTVVVIRLTPASTSPTARPGATPPVPPGPSASPTPPPGAGITGPLTFLLVGVDTRATSPDWVPHADAVMLLRVERDLDRAYLFSLPRDLLVDIPPFPKAGWPGGRTKLTHAMSEGSNVPARPRRPDAAQGYELLRATVTRYTGLPVDAGAVLTFVGFDRLVDSLGGVDLYVDQRVVSQHRQPDGRHRSPGAGGYVGPQMVYEPGERHLTGWQALDYARQRYTAGGDYTRQRHQQQLVRALVRRILDQDLARDPDRVEQVVRALGDSLIWAGGGRRIVDVAYALADLPADGLTLVTLPGRSVGRGSAYRGEELEPVGRRFLAELRAGRADAYLAEHTTLVVRR